MPATTMNNTLRPTVVACMLVILASMSAPAQAANCASCPELCESVQNARTQYIQQETGRQEETILKELKSLVDLSCLDALNTGMNLSMFDPATIIPMIISALKNLATTLCNQAVSEINGQVNQYVSQANNMTTLPYGLGSAGAIQTNRNMNATTSTHSSGNVYIPPPAFP